MKPIALDPADITEQQVIGRVVCNDIVAAGPAGRVKLSKGHVLVAEDIPALRAFSDEVHLLQLDSGDVHEDQASCRLARAIAGDGLVARGPIESQTHLRATRRGLVSVRSDALAAMNSLPDVSVYTVYDGQPVEEGKAVAATKVTPLAILETILAEAEEIARQAFPVASVQPFLGGGVGVIVRERLAGRARDKFERAIHMKVGWFGSPITAIKYLPDDVDAISAALQGLLDADVSLILAAGVNSTDPLDLTLQALDRVGAVTERRGVPSHPGSTCWLAYVRDVPIFGLALCGMFSTTTALDLLLPRFLSGSPVRADDIARLGHGGLLGKEMGFRFPDYAADGPPLDRAETDSF